VLAWLVDAAPMSAAVSASLPPAACDDLCAVGEKVEGTPDSDEYATVGEEPAVTRPFASTVTLV
jgi:hypothetical protein